MSFFPDPTMADSLQDIWSFDCLESVHLAAVQALQASGVVVPTGEHVESAVSLPYNCQLNYDSICLPLVDLPIKNFKSVIILMMSED